MRIKKVNSDAIKLYETSQVKFKVAIGVGANAESPQQPADAKFFVMLFDKPISL